MRLNISNIIAILDCSETIAEEVEAKINELNLLDWSEATAEEVITAVWRAWEEL